MCSRAMDEPILQGITFNLGIRRKNAVIEARLTFAIQTLTKYDWGKYCT